MCLASLNSHTQPFIHNHNTKPATCEDCSHIGEQTAPVTKTLSASQGCPLMGASTVLITCLLDNVLTIQGYQ